MQRKTPLICPSCSTRLNISGLTCGVCETTVTGKFPLPVLASFSAEEQQFIIEFVKSSGSLKDMAQKLGLSYPTVRNMLDDLINKMQTIETTQQ